MLKMITLTGATLALALMGCGEYDAQLDDSSMAVESAAKGGGKGGKGKGGGGDATADCEADCNATHAQCIDAGTHACNPWTTNSVEECLEAHYGACDDGLANCLGGC